MNTNFAGRLTVASLALAGMTASFAAFSAPSAARADTSPAGRILESIDRGSEPVAAGTYSKTITFTYQVTNPSTDPIDGLAGAVGPESAQPGGGGCDTCVFAAESSLDAASKNQTYLGLDFQTNGQIEGNGDGVLVRGRVTGWF